MEHRGARPGQRGRPGQTGVHPGGAAGLLRPRRRAGRPDPRQPAARAGCRRSGTRRCSRPPTRSGCGATRPGCSTCPTSAATRMRRSSASTASATSGTARRRRARRRNGAACSPCGRGAASSAGVVHRGPPRLRHRRQPGGLALRARRPSRVSAVGLTGSPPTGTSSAWTPGWTCTRCAGPTSRTSSRTATTPGSCRSSRSRTRQHDVDLHLRVLGLPHPHVAPGAGCHGRGARWARGRRGEAAKSATGGGCAR